MWLVVGIGLRVRVGVKVGVGIGIEAGVLCQYNCKTNIVIVSGQGGDLHT